MELGFFNHYRQEAIRVTEVYFEHMSNKALAGFSNIEEDARAWADNEWDKMGENWHPDFSPDMSSIAEDVNERSYYYYEDLNFVKNQALGMAIAGMYHLWEKTIKRFLLKEMRRYPSKENIKTINKANFDVICEILNHGGFEFSRQPSFEILNKFRQITNAIKHGDGKALDWLKLKAPELFPHSMIEDLNYHDLISSDDIDLKEDDFLKFKDAIVDFWKNFPNELIFKFAPS